MSHGQQGFNYSAPGHQPGLPHARAIARTLQCIHASSKLWAQVKDRQIHWFVVDHPLYLLLKQKLPLHVEGTPSRRALAQEVNLIQQLAQQMATHIEWHDAPARSFPSTHKLARLICRNTGSKPSMLSVDNLEGYRPVMSREIRQELCRAQADG